VNGRLALERLRDDGAGVGLVLTDFHMPEMDGFELTRRIRNGEAGPGATALPIIALTADALTGTREKCRAAGMDDYLSKPVDIAALAALLAKHLPQALPLRRSPSASASATSCKAAAVEVDPDILDTERLEETFGTVAEALPFLHDFLDSADQMAAELQGHLTAGALGDARHVAHMLKGAGRSAAAERLGRLGAQMQDFLDAGDGETALMFAELLPPTIAELRVTVSRLENG